MIKNFLLLKSDSSQGTCLALVALAYGALGLVFSLFQDPSAWAGLCREPLESCVASPSVSQTSSVRRRRRDKCTFTG